MSTKEEPEVICAVCESFEPHAWRKGVCRNCFHTEEEHDPSNKCNETDVNISKSGDSKSENKDDSAKVKHDTKTSTDKKPPPVLPKTVSKDKGNLKKSTENLKDIDGEVDSKSKGKSSDSSSQAKSSKYAPDNLSITQRIKQNLENKQKTGSSTSNQRKKSDTSSSSESQVEGQVSPVTSQGSKQTTKDKNAGKDTDDAKSGQKNDINKKQTPTTTKVFTNSKLAGSALLLQDKNLSTAGDKKSADKQEKNAATKSKQKDVNLKEKESKEKDKQKDNVKEKESEDKKLSDAGSSKIKNLISKSFTSGDGLDDSKFNSIGRKKFGKDKITSQQTTAESDSKPGIKSPSSKQQGISQKAQNGTPADKTGATSPTPTSPSVNKTSPFGLANKNVAKSSENKFKFGTSRWERGTKEETEKLESLVEDKTKVNGELELLRKKLSQMENKCQTLEEENVKLKMGLGDKEKQEALVKMQKQDVENAIKGLQNELSSMETRCNKLESDNTSLMDKMKEQHQQQAEQQQNAMNEETSDAIRDIEENMTHSEQEAEELKLENEELKEHIQELKVEMDEMYDSFRDQEAEEFRDLQRELEITAKNCRILQFKLRKAERRSDQVEIDRKNYEEKLRLLQNQFEDNDARAHIKSIEEELLMAKEVSVRLHDELDILEDRRSKVEEENLHLTDILEKSDKKQFRLEMEIDKLKDTIYDLKDKLAKKSDDGSASDDMSDRRHKYNIFLDNAYNSD